MTASMGRRFSWQFLAGISLICLAAAVAVKFVFLDPSVPVPRPNTLGANPRVLQLLEAATTDVRRNPASHSSWGNLGMLLMAHHWHSEALECFQKAASLDPREIRWQYLAAILTEQKDLEAADQAYAKAAATNPKYAPLRHRWAVVLMRRNKLDAAAEQFRQLAKLEPLVPHAQLGLGRVARARGELEAARDHFQQALAIRPTNLEVRAELARLRLQLPDGPPAATSSAPTHVEVEPIPDPILREVEKQEVVSRKEANEADELAAQGNLAAATEAYRDLIRNRPELSRPRLNLGSILMTQGKIAEALEVLREAAVKFPTDPMVHFGLASVLEAAQDPAGAMEHLREAIRLKPDYSQAHFSLGLWLERQGDFERAMEAYSSAVQSDPRFAPAQLALGVALQRKGDYEAAIKHIQNAIDLVPNDPVPRQFLDRAIKAREQAQNER
jgi:tetratricopeptide (TPR) repeat protein